MTVSDKPKDQNQNFTLLDSDKFIYILLGIIILIVSIARIHLLSFPFERDEGEYAYMGKLILDGHPPYTLAYNMKFPGTYYMYAIIMSIVGKSVIGIHTGLLIFSIASIILVFLVSKEFVSKIGAVLSAATFGIVGTSWTLSAQAAHATHFVIFFALCGIYFTLKIYKKNSGRTINYFLAGIFYSLAIICKQSGVFFVFAGCAIIIANEYNSVSLAELFKKLSFVLSGVIAPVAIMLFYFYFFGDFNKFWFWTTKYLSEYSVQVPAKFILNNFKFALNFITEKYSAQGYTLVWLISLVGIPFIFIRKGTMKDKIVVFLFVLFSFLTIVPGFYFREHYFISILPAAGLSFAILFDFINDLIKAKLKKPEFVYILLLIFTVPFCSGVFANSEYLFTRDNKISCMKYYHGNPFVESIVIADYIKKHTSTEDKIAILGSEPQILFYADRYSATGYIYTYNLVEIQPYALTMQKEMVREIEMNKPKYILFVNIRVSWLTAPNSEMYIYNWANEYQSTNYKIVGFVDMIPDQISSLKINEQLINYIPRSKEVIYIFERVN